MLSGGLVERAARDRVGVAAQPAAHRLHRIERIVEIGIGRFDAGSLARESAVAEGAIGAAAAMQIVAAPFGAWQRPFLFLAPFLESHHINFYRRAVGDAVLLALERVLRKN